MQSTEKFSKVFVGTMTWGSWGKQLSKQGMIGLMEHCLENGLTTFDHADIYGDYTTEAEFGKAFAESGIDRTQIQLVSKCGIQMTSGRDNHLKHYEYGKDYIIWSAEESLRKLNTEYLDLFLLHRPSPLMHPSEIGEAIDHLLESGKIRQFGVSNFTPSQIALLESVVEVKANQVEFSLTHTAPMYDGTFDDCLANKRLTMAWSPLGQVFREENAQTVRINKTLSQLVDKYGVDESQVLLAWMLRHPAVPRPVIGTTTKERINSSAKAAQLDLELQDWFALLEASQGHEVP
ncbi:aldo/keto reductase [Flagellimonas algicola]|uniref:Aldo/keto reductase n=1 Tax=Flagellimonas algicola TaxID=2583815 RepID=A0ABY2WKA3_9FLAO|nr:aldo/keto reductase [Allomuricauda algicola]TMU55258.1 aldo/keto reductase [Allomuricauda algicola]